MNVHKDLRAAFARAWDMRPGTLLSWAPEVGLPDWTAPLAAAGSLVALALLAGIAMAALGTLLLSLLLAIVILDRVFGLRIIGFVPR